MPQLFRPGANAVARTSLYGLVFCVGLAGSLGYVLDRSPYSTRQRTPREQPVPFSHAHHVGDDGIDCLYCHTGIYSSGFANIPPVKTCMDCHSQIWDASPALSAHCNWHNEPR